MSHSPSDFRSAAGLIPTSEWEPPADPIFGLTTAFRADTRKGRVNLGVGAYRDADGMPYVLGSVRIAERKLLDQKLNKEYFPILGSQEFGDRASELIFGPLGSDEELRARSVIVGTPGGTAALRVGGEWIALGGPRTVYLSDPTWANHQGVMIRAGLATDRYPYFDFRQKNVRFQALLESLDTMPSGSVLLLQASCHNPTGTDLTSAQWKELGARMLERGLIPFFDLAYQGLGSGLEKDAQAIHIFLQQGHSFLVAYSFSKNFGLYGERVGALAVITGSTQAAGIAKKQLQTVVRGNYSNPPIHGLRVVVEILRDDELRKQWHAELETMRQRINEMRKAFVGGLRAGGFSKDLDQVASQKGMFSFGFLTVDEVHQLRKQHAVYLPDDGRINVAGLSPRNMDAVVEAMLSVGV